MVDRRRRDAGRTLHDAFVDNDATLIEVNPLIVTSEREVVALDAKVTIDNSALFRHEELGGDRRSDPADEDPQEQMAKERGLTYVKLDGDIGILGNGAGLCMSTLDVVANAGGDPANFLDAGGGSKAEAIVDALEVITSDEKVNAVLFNIFGGITRCDEVAKGIIEAYSRVDMDVPLVVRLDGTNSEEGLKLLAEADLDGLHNETTMLGAAERVVELAKRGADDGIIVDNETKLVVSGLTGREGSFHGLRNREYGTDLVAGVTPGKGGQDVEGVPIFDTIKEAVDDAGANTSMIFVPARFAGAAINEAIDAGVRHGDRDHRGHPGPRHAADLLEGQGGGRPADRPELPRRALARQGERRDHPGPVLRRRARSASSPSRAR